MNAMLPEVYLVFIFFNMYQMYNSKLISEFLPFVDYITLFVRNDLLLQVESFIYVSVGFLQRCGNDENAVDPA